jgi:hypothetical protein
MDVKYTNPYKEEAVLSWSAEWIISDERQT